MESLNILGRKLQVDDTNDDYVNHERTQQLENTLSLNLAAFVLLMALFEGSRRLKSIYFPRLNKRFEVSVIIVIIALMIHAVGFFIFHYARLPKECPQNLPNSP